MAQRKIIATVINDLNNDRRMQRICNALVDAGFDVCLIGRQLPNSKPIRPARFHQKRLRCLFHQGPLFYIEYNVRLWVFLMFAKFDIGNSVDADTLAAVGIATWLKRKKLVHDAHEYFSEVPELIDRPIVKSVWLGIERIFIPRAALAYTVSESIARIYQEKYKIPFSLIMNVPEWKENSTENHPNRNTLIYQGALNKGRGIEAILKAMVNLDARLWIAGSGDIEQELKTMTHDLNLEEKVSFLGMLDPGELREVTLKAGIGLNICEPLGLNYYYALSNKGFDYIHAGIPAVTNDFPEYQRLNKQYETMVLTDTTPEAIERAINELITDDELYQRLRKNCFLAAKALNWQHESAKLIALYEKLG